ncbi:MAG: sortase [Acidimicrobiia bacterium]
MQEEPADSEAAAERPRKHVPKHRRSKAPGWYDVMGYVGRTLIGLGVLILLFVVYQLWGTNLQEARAQDQLEDKFRDRIAELTGSAPTTAAASTSTAGATTTAAPTTAAPTTVAPTTVATTSNYTIVAGDTLEVLADRFSTTTDAIAKANGLDLTKPLQIGQVIKLPDGAKLPPVSVPTTIAPIAAPGQPLPTIKEGDPLAQIDIPKIGVSRIIVAGVETNDLKKGPGHYPDTPLPGQKGNVAIAGHRTTYGAPFNRVDELDVGDDIVLTDLYGQQFRYKVTEQKIISPSDFSVLDQTDDATLTLTSCHPKYSAAKRIVIKAALDTTASPAPTAPTPNAYADTKPSDDPNTVATTTLPGDDSDQQPTTTESQPVLTNSSDAFNRGWFSDSSAWSPTLLYGLTCALIGIAAWAFARRRKPLWWLIYVGAVPVLLFFLYFFYENLSRLLPPSI